MNITITSRTLLLGAGLVGVLILGLSLRPQPVSETYVYRQFSTIESVVPGGLGRSRVIISNDKDQEVGKDLLNFYSMVGINFKNVANNDRMIVQTLNEYMAEGWELHTVTTGVNNASEGTGGTGIFITRYLLRKPL